MEKLAQVFFLVLPHVADVTPDIVIGDLPAGSGAFGAGIEKTPRQYPYSMHMICSLQCTWIVELLLPNSRPY